MAKRDWQHKPQVDAEADFFSALASGEVKTAIELQDESAELLGIPTVSPSTLDKLEREAAQEAEPEASPPEEETSDQTPSVEAAVEDVPIEEPEEASVELKKFDRADKAPETELPSRATHGRLFSDKRSHPLQILDVLTLRYKTKWVDWESDTLWWSLRKSFGSIGEVNRNKIMALRLAATSDMTWLDWDIFEDSGLSWNDIVPTIGSFQPMTPMQAAFTVQVLRGIRPDDEFAHEVRAYIAAILDEHGWIWAPEEFFGDVQSILDRDREHLSGLKEEVIAAWKKVKNVDPETIEWSEDALSIHILKLFVVKRYLEERAAVRQEVPGSQASSSTTSPPVP